MKKMTISDDSCPSWRCLVLAVSSSSVSSSVAMVTCLYLVLGSVSYSSASSVLSLSFAKDSSSFSSEKLSKK